MINSTLPPSILGNFELPTNEDVYHASLILNSLSILASGIAIAFAIMNNENKKITIFECIGLLLTILVAILNITFTALKDANLGVNICNYFAIVACTAQFMCMSYEGKISFANRKKVASFILSIIVSGMIITNVMYVNTYTYEEQSDANKITFSVISGVLALLTIGSSIFTMAKDRQKRSLPHAISALWHVLSLAFACVGSVTLVNQLSFLTGDTDIQIITYSNVADEANPGLVHTIQIQIYKGSTIMIIDTAYQSASQAFVQTTTYDLMNNTMTIDRTAPPQQASSATPMVSAIRKTSATVNATGITKFNYVKLLPHITQLVGVPAGIASTTQTTLTNVTGPNNSTLLHNLTYTVDSSDNQVLLVRDVITANNDSKTYICTQTYDILHDLMTSINSSNVDGIVYNPVIRPYIASNADSKWTLNNEVSQTIKHNVGFVADSSNLSLIHQLNYIIENNIVVAVEDKVYTNDNGRTYLCTAMYDISNNVQTVTDASGSIVFNNFVILPNHIITNCNSAWTLSLDTLNTTQVVNAVDSSRPNMSHSLTLTLNALNQVINIQDFCTLNSSIIETETYDLLNNITTNLIPSGVISSNQGVNIPTFIQDAINAAGLQLLKLTSLGDQTSINQKTSNNVNDIFNPNVTHNITYSYNSKNVITEIVDNIYANNQLLTTITYDLSINLRNINNGLSVSSYSGVVLYDYLLSKADGNLTIPSGISKPFITQVQINRALDDMRNPHDLTFVCNGSNVLMVKDIYNGQTTIYDINNRFTTIGNTSSNGVVVPSFILDALHRHNQTNKTSLFVDTNTQSTQKIITNIADAYNDNVFHNLKYVYNNNSNVIGEITDDIYNNNQLIQSVKYNLLTNIVSIENGSNSTSYAGVVLYDYLLNYVNGRLTIPSNITRTGLTTININGALDDGDNSHDLLLICSGPTVLMIQDGDTTYNINSRFKTVSGVSTNGSMIPSFIMNAVRTYNSNSLNTKLFIPSDLQANNIIKQHSYIDPYNTDLSHDVKFIFTPSNELIWIEDTNKLGTEIIQVEKYNVSNRSKIVTTIKGTSYSVQNVTYPVYMSEHVDNEHILGTASRTLSFERNGINIIIPNGAYHNVTYIVDNKNVIGIIDDIYDALNQKKIATEKYSFINGVKTRSRYSYKMTFYDGEPVYTLISTDKSSYTDFIVPSYITANMNSDWIEIGTIKKTDNYTYELNDNDTFETVLNVVDSYSQFTSHDVTYTYDNNTDKNVIYIEDITSIHVSSVDGSTSKIIVQSEFYDLINGLRYSVGTGNSNTFTPIGILDPITSSLGMIDEDKLPKYIIDSKPIDSKISASNIETKTITKNALVDSHDPSLKHNIVYVMDRQNNLLSVKDETYIDSSNILKTTIVDIYSGLTTSELISGNVKVSQQLFMTPTVVDNAPTFINISDDVIKLDALKIMRLNEYVIGETGLVYDIDYIRDKDGDLVSLRCKTYQNDDYFKSDGSIKANRSPFQTEKYDFVNGIKTITNSVETLVSDDTRIVSAIANKISNFDHHLEIRSHQTLDINHSFLHTGIIDARNPTLKHDITYLLNAAGEIAYVKDELKKLDGILISTSTYDLVSNVLLGSKFEMNPSLPSYINANKTSDNYTNTVFLGPNNIELLTLESKENKQDMFGDVILNSYIKHDIKYYSNGDKIVLIKDEHKNTLANDAIIRTDYYDFNNNIHSTLWPDATVEYISGADAKIIGGSYIELEKPANKTIAAENISTGISVKYEDNTGIDNNEMVANEADYYYDFNKEIMMIENTEKLLNSSTVLSTVYYDRYRKIKVIVKGTTATSYPLFIPKSLADKGDSSKNAITGTIVVEYAKDSGTNVSHSVYSDIKHVIRYVTEGGVLIAVEDTCAATGVTPIGAFEKITVNGQDAYLINKKIYDIKRNLTFTNSNGTISSSELKIPDYIKSTASSFNTLINNNLFMAAETESASHSLVDKYNSMLLNNVKYVYNSTNEAQMVINDIKADNTTKTLLERNVYDLANMITVHEVYGSNSTVTKTLSRGVVIGESEIQSTHKATYKIGDHHIGAAYTTVTDELVDPINTLLKHSLTYVYGSDTKVVYILDRISTTSSDDVMDISYSKHHKLINNDIIDSWEINYPTFKVWSYIIANIVSKNLSASNFTPEVDVITFETANRRLVENNDTNGILGDYVAEVLITKKHNNVIALQKVSKEIMENSTSSAAIKSNAHEVTYDYINNITITKSGNTTTVDNGTGTYSKTNPYVLSGTIAVTKHDISGPTDTYTTLYKNSDNKVIRVIEDVTTSGGAFVSTTYYDLTSITEKYIKLTLDENDSVLTHHIIEKSALPAYLNNYVDTTSEVVSNDISVAETANGSSYYMRADLTFTKNASNTVTKVVERTKAIQVNAEYMDITETTYDLVAGTTTISYLFDLESPPTTTDTVKLPKYIKDEAVNKSLTIPSTTTILTTDTNLTFASDYKLMNSNGQDIQSDILINKIYHRNNSTNQPMITKNEGRITLIGTTTTLTPYEILYDNIRNVMSIYVNMEICGVRSMSTPFVAPTTVTPMKTAELDPVADSDGNRIHWTKHIHPNNTSRSLRITKNVYTDEQMTEFVYGKRYDYTSFGSLYVASTIDASGKIVSIDGLIEEEEIMD